MTQNIEMVLPEEDDRHNDTGDDLVLPVGDAATTEDQPAEFAFDEDEANLVETFMGHPDGKDALKKLSAQVIEDYEEAFAASKKYRERVAKDWALFSGELPPKDWPFEGCANVHIPIMLETITRVAFRSFSELFPDWNNVFGVSSMGPPDDDEAKALTIHGNWQIREQIPDFKRQMHKGMLGFWAIGDMTCHSYYDVERRQNRHEFLTVDEFITPYAMTTMMPDYSDLPFYVKVLKRYKHQLEAERDRYFEVEEVIEKKPPMWDEDPEMPLNSAVAKAQGVEPTDTERASPYTLLWYEGWADLPTQDRQRFIKAIVDHRTKRILHLCILEEANWQDVQRYEAQSAELASYRQQKTAYQELLTQQQQQIMGLTQQIAAVSHTMGPLQMMGAQQGLQEAQAQAEQIQPPPAPSWMKNPEDPEEQPEEPKKEPIYLFTHFVCIEPLVGNLGFSYGRLEADFNRAANTLASQFVDQATLSNVKYNYVSSTVQFPDGHKITPGKNIRVAGLTGPELKNNIMPVEPGPANPQLAEFADKIYAWGQAAAQAPAVLSGDPGKSGETFRGISARIEQATKQLSVGTRKFAETLVYVLKNNARLNSKFLRDEELLAVVSPQMGQAEPLKIGRRMYERDYRVEVKSDMRFASMAERIAESDEMLKMPAVVPPLQQNLYFIWQATKKAFEARGRWDMIPALGPCPPAPQTTFGMPPPPPPGMMPPPPPGPSNGPLVRAAPGAPPLPKGPPHPPMPPAGA